MLEDSTDSSTPLEAKQREREEQQLERSSSSPRLSRKNSIQEITPEKLPEADVPEAKSWFDFIHPEYHKAGGQYIKSIIYGGLDGIVSIFVTVAAASGGNIGVTLILVLGLAKLFAGGLSMGIGDWLATDAEVDMAKRERKREEWECDNFLEGEIDEMVELYTNKGMDEAASREIMAILSKNKNAFVDIMMAEELGIPPDIENEVPWKHGAINFASFMGFGVVPLLVYILVAASSNSHASSKTIFYISIAVTAMTLTLMGLIKGKLTGSSLWKSALITLLFGSFTAFIGWFVGWILNYFFPGVNID